MYSVESMEDGRVLGYENTKTDAIRIQDELYRHDKLDTYIRKI